MTANNYKKETGLKIQIGLPEGKEWSKSDLAGIKDFIKKESQKRTPEQQLNTKLLAIKYKMEEYLEDKDIKATL